MVEKKTYLMTGKPWGLDFVGFGSERESHTVHICTSALGDVEKLISFCNLTGSH